MRRSRSLRYSPASSGTGRRGRTRASGRARRHGDVSRCDCPARDVVEEVSERALGIALGASDRSTPPLPLAAERIAADADDELPHTGPVVRACDRSQLGRNGTIAGECWMIAGCSCRPSPRSGPLIALSWRFAVRPLGFEPRTCGLRVASWAYWLVVSNGIVPAHVHWTVQEMPPDIGLCCPVSRQIRGNARTDVQASRLAEGGSRRPPDAWGPRARKANTGEPHDA